MLTNLITGIIGILMICAFLGFMLVWVKALPLIVIVVVSISLLVYDFIDAVRSGESA
jgi:hypothetical protein